MRFKYGRGLRSSDGLQLRGFSVVNNKGYSRNVAASIVKDEVIIPLSRNENVTELRYAWDPYTTANLVNHEGLPASTFTMQIK